MAERELDLGRRTADRHPAYRKTAATSWAIAIGLHVAVLLVIVAAFGPRRIQAGVTTLHQSIGAFVFPGEAAATSGAQPVERKPAPAPKPSPDAGENTAEDTASSAQEGSGDATASLIGGGGPVRLTAGINVHLLKRIVPEYPRMMQAAGVPGVVILDAIIQRDGTIGDITVLKSTSPVFTQAAIAAVKQWQYTPIPYEGIVTVTLTFTLNA